MAAVYTHGHHESVLRSHRWRTAENSAAYLLPHLRPGQSLLDVGCGPGTITADLAARWSRPGGSPALEATADGARAWPAPRSRGRGLDNVDFVVGDVHALDFPDDTFDVVHAHQVLQHVADPVAALREMRRVCRPGGVVAVRDSDYAAFTWFPRLPELDEWLALYQRVARGQRRRARRRPPTAVLGARGRASPTSPPTSSTWCFATPGGPGLVGRHVGGAGRRRPAWPGRRWHGGSPPRPTCSGSPTGGGAGPRPTDGWMSVLHGEMICRA